MEKISGFSLVRNGAKFDYPFLESWRSLLPLVDELVLNVGKSDDDSLEIAERFAREEGQGKVRIFETVWPLNDPQKKKSGLILSEQTNLALEQCVYDWCFYIQADEVLHEDDLPLIRKAVEQAAKDEELEAVVFEYRHFYGSFNVIQETRSAYRREMRLVRKSSGAKSFGDAQSFRKPDGSKLKALLSTARIFHYGWVRTPDAMKEGVPEIEHHAAPQVRLEMPTAPPPVLSSHSCWVMPAVLPAGAANETRSLDSVSTGGATATLSATRKLCEFPAQSDGATQVTVTVASYGVAPPGRSRAAGVSETPMLPGVTPPGGTLSQFAVAGVIEVV